MVGEYFFNIMKSRSLFRQVKNMNHEIDGSLILFISFLFLIALIISMGIVDISDSFLAKRELISAGENLLSAGVQQIDLSRYYEDGIDPLTGRVPINCPQAISVMNSLIAEELVRGVHPSLESAQCVRDSLSISLSMLIKPLVIIPFVSEFSHGEEVINAHLNEASIAK